MCKSIEYKFSQQMTTEWDLTNASSDMMYCVYN